MQREIEDLRRQLQVAKSSNLNQETQVVAESAAPRELSQNGTSTKPRGLGDVKLSGKIVDDLFKEFVVLYSDECTNNQRRYFTYYHAYLPFLDSEMRPDQYFDLLPLLGWSVIIVAARRFRNEPLLLEHLSPHYRKLLWSTISESPQPYHVVKALCLICAWPLPSTSNPSDITFSLSCMMMSLALQNILDFPVHLQFSKGKVAEDEQRDRRLTWCACNIVSQR